MRLPAPQARVTIAVLAALVTLGAARPGTAPAAATLPPRLNGYLQTHVRLDEASRAKLLAGRIVRGKAREEVEKGTEAVLRVTKVAFEGK